MLKIPLNSLGMLGYDVDETAPSTGDVELVVDEVMPLGAHLGAVQVPW